MLSRRKSETLLGVVFALLSFAPASSRSIVFDPLSPPLCQSCRGFDSHTFFAAERA